MKDQVKVPILVAAVVVLVALVGFIGMKAMGAGDLDQGQVKYTPGKPPWMESDPSKRGPGGTPGSGAAGAPTPPEAGNHSVPPGMTAPRLGIR